MKDPHATASGRWTSKPLFLVLAWLLWLGAPRAVSADHPAGIVLYSRTGGEVHLLVADHAPPSRRGWAAFGGSHEKGETPAQTAARETEEETRGLFTREFLLEKIKNQTPVYDGKFALYFVQVKQVPVERFGAIDLSSRDAAFHERGPYAWIPYAEVAKYLDPGMPIPSKKAAVIDAGYLPQNRHSDWLWQAWLQNMRQAAKENAIPWQSRKQ